MVLLSIQNTFVKLNCHTRSFITQCDEQRTKAEAKRIPSRVSFILPRSRHWHKQRHRRVPIHQLNLQHTHTWTCMMICQITLSSLFSLTVCVQEGFGNSTASVEALWQNTKYFFYVFTCRRFPAGWSQRSWSQEVKKQIKGTGDPWRFILKNVKAFSSQFKRSF